MRTYSISFNGNAPESWTHEAVKADEFAFRSTEIAAMGSLAVGQSVRLHDGTRATLVEV